MLASPETGRALAHARVLKRAEGGARHHQRDPREHRTAPHPGEAGLRHAREDAVRARGVAGRHHGAFAIRQGTQPAEGHLGLSLLEDLAAREGARLDVQSEPGRGTVFTLEVPDQ